MQLSVLHIKERGQTLLLDHSLHRANSQPHSRTELVRANDAFVTHTEFGFTHARGPHRLGKDGGCRGIEPAPAVACHPQSVPSHNFTIVGEGTGYGNVAGGFQLSILAVIDIDIGCGIQRLLQFCPVSSQVDFLSLLPRYA